MSIKHARMATAVVLALSSGVTLAATYAQDFQKGFYVGLNGGVSFVTGQTYNELAKGAELNSPFRNSTTIFRDEASARGYNGGLFIGWNFYCDREYIYSIQLSGNAYTNRAYQTFWSGGEYETTSTNPTIEVDNFEESWRLTYSGDLTLRPGYFVSDSTQVYAILGASAAQLKTRLKRLEVNGEGNGRRQFFGEDEGEKTDKKTVYGFVLGAGVQKQLCNRLSVFTSYEYTYYGRHSLEDFVLESGSVDFNAVHNRDLRIDSNQFKLGLLYTF